MEGQNPENLHDKLKDSKMHTTPQWDNTSTPVNPLVAEKDLSASQIAPKGTETLRSSLIKD